jgi:hypothetical protein
MAIDKKIDYEIQGGVKNYRPSEMVTVPKIAKSSPSTPTAKLAYITPEEEKILVDLNLYGSLKGKPNRGPGGIPSLEGDFGGPGGFGGFRGGGDYSSAETGNASGFDGTGGGGGPELPPGVQRKPSKEAQDIRSAFIAAGGGRRVNPRFFDSRNTVSPAELARARAFNPAAFKAGRRGGIMDFFTGGGFLGNIVRGLGQKFGLGKKFNEPTYDMSRFNKLGLGGLDPFANLDIRDIYDRRKTDEEDQGTSIVGEENILGFKNPSAYLGPNLNEGIFMDYQELDESGIGSKPKFGGTVLYDEFPSTRLPDMRDLGNPYADPRIVPEERGLEPGPTPFTFDDRRREEGPKLGIGSDFDKDIEDYLSQAGNQGIMQLAEVSQKDIDASKARGFNKLDRDTAVTLGLISPNVTEYEFEQLKQGNITEPGTYTA